MSLRLRLGLGIALVVALSLGVLGFAVVTSTRSSLLSIAHRQLEQSLSNRVRSSPPPRGTGRSATDPRVLATAHIVIGPDGSVVVAEPAGPPTDPRPLPDLTPTDIAALRNGRTVTANAVDGSLPYLVLGQTVPASGVLEIEALPVAEIDATISTLTNRFASGALITLLLAVVAVLILLIRGLRPLDHVIVTADAVAAGEREQRIVADRGPTEIRHLSAALDRMLQQQQSALTAKESSEALLRRFVADASHELQTPSTSVLGWAELQRKGALDAAGQQTAVARIEAESRRMARLVDELLLLARLDERRPFETHPVDLATIAREAVGDATAAGGDDHPIDLVAPAPVVVAGDAARLRQVFDNLLRNVRVHTPAGTRARVVVSSAGAHATVAVEDDGPGLDDEQLEHVFDRFWRGDTSRTRATGGSGLGLAIVSALIDAHHGAIGVAPRSGGGTVFTVSLPLTPG